MWFEQGSGPGGLAWIPEDGSAPPQFLTRSADPQLPCQWTPDGRTLIVLSVPRSRPNEVNLVSFSPDGTVALRRWRDTRVPFGTDVNEPALSPDGRWLAYTSTEARSPEVYVDSFGTPGSLTKVSINGGRSPIWAPDSRTLYYTEQQSSGLQRMMSVEVRGTPTLSAPGPRPLFEGRWVNRSNTGSVRLTADGRRFLLVVSANPEPRPLPAPTQIHLIQNWFEELKAKVR